MRKRPRAETGDPLFTPLKWGAYSFPSHRVGVTVKGVKGQVLRGQEGLFFFNAVVTTNNLLLLYYSRIWYNSRSSTNL